MQSAQRGFTLIELLVAIGIMATVFAVSIPLYTSYTSQRAFEAMVEEIRTQLNYAYANSTQGVLGVDKSTDANSPPQDTDTTTDRVAWFVMLNKTTEEYAIGACLPDRRPNESGMSCVTDSDYRVKNVSSVVNINYAAGSYSGTIVYASFMPITGTLTVWGNAGSTPVLVNQNFDIVLTSRYDASQSATLRVNAQGGVRQL